MRCMTSEPVPHMTGSRPAMITATVMAIGRTRSAAPSTIACVRSRSSVCLCGWPIDLTKCGAERRRVAKASLTVSRCQGSDK